MNFLFCFTFHRRMRNEDGLARLAALQIRMSQQAERERNHETYDVNADARRRITPDDWNLDVEDYSGSSFVPVINRIILFRKRNWPRRRERAHHRKLNRTVGRDIGTRVRLVCRPSVGWQWQRRRITGWLTGVSLRALGALPFHRTFSLASDTKSVHPRKENEVSVPIYSIPCPITWKRNQNKV